MSTLLSGTERTPVGIRVATAVGITASAYLVGANLSLSYGTIPVIMQAPAGLAAQQWAKMYEIGKSVGLSSALISAISTGYVAYNQDPSSLPFKLNLAAAIIFPCIVPFTVLAIKPTNDKLYEKRDALASTSLEDKAVEAGVAQGETVHALLDKWALLNAVRAAIVATGTVLAVWAAVDKLEAKTFTDAALRAGANRLG